MTVEEQQQLGCVRGVGFFNQGKSLPADYDAASMLIGADGTKHVLNGIRSSYGIGAFNCCPQKLATQ
jgi:hypothetical protein